MEALRQWATLFAIMGLICLCAYDIFYSSYQLAAIWLFIAISLYNYEIKRLDNV